MKQLIHYGLVGLSSNAVIYIIYLLLTHFYVEPKVAMTLIYIIGAILGFIGNKNWTFSCRSKSLSVIFRYFLAHLFGYILNFCILLFFVDDLGYAHQVVQAVAIIIVAGFLFIIFKYFVFRGKI